MGLFFVVIASAAVAYLVGKVWAISIPIVMGLVVAAAILTGGGSFDDTPLPFVTVLATIAAGSAIFVRRRVTPI